MKTSTVEILTLEEIADLTRYDIKYLRNNYMKLLVGQGVQKLSIAPNAEPRFLKSEIMSLMMRRK